MRRKNSSRNYRSYRNYRSNRSNRDGLFDLLLLLLLLLLFFLFFLSPSSILPDSFSYTLTWFWSSALLFLPLSENQSVRALSGPASTRLPDESGLLLYSQLSHQSAALSLLYKIQSHYAARTLCGSVCSSHHLYSIEISPGL